MGLPVCTVEHLLSESSSGAAITSGSTRLMFSAARAAGDGEARVSQIDVSPYGLHRVLGQPGVLPQPADRLDAEMPCQSTEIEISVEQLHIDASSFRQLRTEHADDADAIHAALLALVRRRGKLHNPVTNSGGMLIGAARQVGPGHPSPPAVGCRIATLASLSLTPLRLEWLGPIDLQSSAVAARGTAFLFQTGAWAELPPDIPEPVSLAALDVAGAPARVKSRTQRGSRVLVIGAGHSGALSAVAASDAGAAEVLVADIDAGRLDALAALGVPRIRAIHGDARNAVAFAELVGTPVDLSVSCVDVPHTEAACILATQHGGHILFFGMATDFARAALCAEGVGSGATLEIGNGFVPGHAALVIDMLRRHRGLWTVLDRAAPSKLI
jgi:L-erythro-3,5-diaminohexanoate dehydrogenase